MKVRAAIERLINVKRADFSTQLLLCPLLMLSVLYRCGIIIRGTLYKWNIFKKYRLPCKIISVGNITVGGTGKTPVVCFLARFFTSVGFKVAVLTRGYRAKSKINSPVVSDGIKVFARSDQAGDEAYMLALKLSNVPVLSGMNRVSLGWYAIRHYQSEILILDDGFQYCQLERDLDIVLINAGNPFGNGFLLPRGILREPLSSLRRAQMIMLTKSEDNSLNIGELKGRVQHYSPQSEVFLLSLEAKSARKTLSDERMSCDVMTGKRAVAFCSIGDPDSFFSMLESLKVILIKTIAFPDHHWYSEKDYKKIECFSNQADFIITTEKDVAKIDSLMLENEKLIALEIDVDISEKERFCHSMARLLGISTQQKISAI